MMEKVLLVARIGKFFSDFELSDIQILQDMGYEVWCAGNYDGDNHKLDGTGVKKVHLSFRRSPLSMENIREYKKLVQIIRENDFKLMHCHMPVGGVFARLAAKKTGLHPVIYTAHGFQFCKGGPIRDWLLFYPVEKLLSRYTDMLITINEEDYQLASSKFHAKQVVHLNGIGIDIDKFSGGTDIRNQLCTELNIPQTSYLMLSVGELSKRKNHEVVLRAIQLLNDKSVHYIISGIGALENYLRELGKELHIENQIHFLGWRDDINDLCKTCDLFVFPSKREGLPVALMEAMAAGMPVVAARARGNTELVENGKNGILCSDDVPDEYAEGFRKIRKLNTEKVVSSNTRILQPYAKQIIQQKMVELYREILD